MIWTRHSRMMILSGTVAVLAPGIAAAQGQASPFSGTWHLNAAVSKPAPGETLPSDLTTDIGRVDSAHVHWSTTATSPKGEKIVHTFDNPGNGEFYSLDGTTMVSHTVSPTRLQSTFRDNHGQSDVLTCTLSGNARQMTCGGVITHQDGSVAPYTDVFDRIAP